jgi:hypothetical protein
MLLLAFAAVSGVCGVIDVSTEQLLPLAQLARRLPHRRGGRPVHPSTCHRWRHPGVRGVRLECIRIGNVWHTSLESFQRFCDQLSQTPSAAPTRASAGSAGPSAPHPVHESQEQVERELTDRGL